MNNSLLEQLGALQLTEMESNTVIALINGLYAEASFSDVDAKDLSSWTGIPTRSIRGVLSSLTKKGIVTIDDNGAGYQIVYLCEQFWYLHPEWKNETI
jgi:sugar-specific transcriptional regulator TrmB